MNKIADLCLLVHELTDEDFREADEIIHGQLEYCHPLKMATAGWQHQLGEHNRAVVAKLRELKEIIEQGANIKRPGGDHGGD
ncbi:hypothetical protein [Desulfovibrio piger]|jgi:hypothetical protein|uniref:hypothetical protein n=1 Tax=Desulfovibrio piger TaxID=901 RepID=UPI0026F1699D|nr:hypothetical protein [Desulfovibrio piger]